MIKLGYSTSGLINLNLIQAIHVVEEAGYSEIELSFHQQQFNPFQISDQELILLQEEFKKRRIKPACIASPTFFFMEERPHDPSLICVDLAGRKQRIHLIKEAIRIAKILKTPIVSFGSGFIRDELSSAAIVDAETLLIDSIHQCLDGCEDIILTIEPEPGMYIETLEQGINLVKKINSKNFQLHIDLCHAFCSEKNYLDALRKAAPYTQYVHVSDTQEGCNLKVVVFSEKLILDFKSANYLVYFDQTADFLFMDQEHSIYFHEDPLDKAHQERLESIRHINGQNVQYVPYNHLYMGKSIYDAEIKVYAISLPKLSFYIIDRIKPIVHYLRTKKSEKTGQLIMDKKVANTLTGKVHFHDIPGKGEIDFHACFKILIENGFSGACIVELYHHVDVWQDSLNQSLQFLTSCLPQMTETTL